MSFKYIFSLFDFYSFVAPFQQGFGKNIRVRRHSPNMMHGSTYINHVAFCLFQRRVRLSFCQFFNERNRETRKKSRKQPAAQFDMVRTVQDESRTKHQQRSFVIIEPRDTMESQTKYNRNARNCVVNFDKISEI